MFDNLIIVDKYAIKVFSPRYINSCVGSYILLPASVWGEGGLILIILTKNYPILIGAFKDPVQARNDLVNKLTEDWIGINRV